MSNPSKNESEPLQAVEVSMTPLQRYEEFLQARGLRNTSQKKFLLEQVFNRHEHFDADLLIEQLPSRGSTNYVSRPTVYRTLKEFVDAGLLHRFELDGRSMYELNYGYPEHDHLYCTKCRQLIEFTSDEIVRLRDEVARSHRFRVKDHRFIIQGVCDQCAKKRSLGRRQDRV
ncbi:MAG: transcriptional repressor [Planctomycetaceae bacterium]|jgi:Fur family ferric uptake transcriptional regulator|nr:transcriptional repressor [Planctomycetaceae bacterium]